MKTTTKKTQCIEAWFKDHKKGQLENIWHKWTWIKGSSLRCSTMLIVLFMSLNIAAQSQYKRGYPQRGDNFDVLLGFRQPPKGYGNVPFYWWSGDKLTRERLEAQLDILSESATDGFAISYIHTHPQIDSLFNKTGMVFSVAQNQDLLQSFQTIGGIFGLGSRENAPNEM